MYLHPDGIAQRIRWETNDGQHNWQDVVDRLCSMSLERASLAKQRGARTTPSKHPLNCPLDREQLVRGVKAMEPGLRHLASHPDAVGREPDVLNHVRPHLLARANELATLA